MKYSQELFWVLGINQEMKQTKFTAMELTFYGGGEINNQT